MSFRLQFENTDGHVVATSTFAEGEVTVGRSDDCDVTLDSTSVSRRHARFFTHLGKAYIEDQHSANGIVVDGQRIRGMHALQHGSTIVFGDHIARFETDSVGHRTASPSDHTVDAVRAWTPSLVRLDRTFDGNRVLPLAADVARIGRSASADLQVVDASVSRAHAELRVEGTSVIVTDLGSANGTHVDGERIHHPTQLAERSVIHCGDIPMLFTGTPQNVRWSDVQIPVIGETSGRPTLLLVVAAALASTVIVGAALVIMLSRAPSTPEPDPAAEAAAAMDAKDWTTAAAAYEAVLEDDPTNQSVVSLLGHARREATAQDDLAACNADLTAAERLQFGNDTEAAITAFTALVTCFRAVDDGTTAAQDANERLSAAVIPPLIELHRLAGLQALQAETFDPSIEHLREAVRLTESNAIDAAEVRNELRNAYLASGQAAYRTNGWAKASSMLQQAGEITPLEPAQTEMLTTARANAGRSR